MEVINLDNYLNITSSYTDNVQYKSKQGRTNLLFRYILAAVYGTRIHGRARVFWFTELNDVSNDAKIFRKMFMKEK